MSTTQRVFRVRQKGRCSVHMHPAGAAAPDLDVLQDFRLQRRTQAFDGLEAPGRGRGFELSQRSDAKLFIELDDLFGPQSGYGKHFQHTRRDVFAYRFQEARVQLSDDIGNSVAHPGDFLEASLGDDPIERLGERTEAFGGADIGFGAVGIAAAKRSALAVFP